MEIGKGIAFVNLTSRICLTCGKNNIDPHFRLSKLGRPLGYFTIFPNGFNRGPYMDGCQNYGPFLDPYYNTAPNI